MTLDDLILRIADFCSDGVVIAEAEPERGFADKIVWCNTAICEQSGLTREDVIGDTPQVLRNSKVYDEEFRAYKEGLATRQPFRTEMTFKKCDGASYPCELDVSPVFGGEGDLRYWVFYIRDISARVALNETLMRSEGQLRAAENRLWSAIDAMPYAFALFDSDDRLVYFNSDYREYYEKRDAAVFVGMRFRDVLTGILDAGLIEIDQDRETWLAERLERRKDLSGPFIQRLTDGRSSKIYDFRTATGDTGAILVDYTAIQEAETALRDKTERLGQTLEELERLANTDSLTGLANRAALDRAYENTPDADSPVAFVQIDLDRFKPINDVFGHAAGDHVLRLVADTLRELVDKGDFIARIGGDEFAVVLHGSDTEEVRLRAKGIASRVIAACSAPVPWHGKRLYFGACIGIASGRAGGMSRIPQDADIALHKAKVAGRNRIAVFTPKLRSEVEERKALADELLAGMQRGEMVAYFQPQVDAATEEPIGAEALVRWQHPERGVLAPNVFLPIVEDLGIAADIDQIVFAEALKMAEAAVAAGTPLKKMSVNVSYGRLAALKDLEPVLLSRPWPCQLAFELLEAIDFDGESTGIKWTLDGLREMGISIEIDDFGSGRASLTTLLNIRPDRIKIDRDIVKQSHAANGGGASALIAAIADICRGLDIAITAEGIETEEQARKMRQLGCDVFQGYLYSKPLAPDAFLAWLQDQSSQALTA